MYKEAKNKPFSYDSCFQTFLDSTDQKEVMQGVWERVISRLLTEMTVAPALYVTDVGIGEGLFAQKYLEIIDRFFLEGERIFTGIDPAENLIDKAAERLWQGQGVLEEEDGTLVSGRDRLIAAPFFDSADEIFFELGPEGCSDEGVLAHLVLCSHALYYAKDAGLAVANLESLRCEQGILIMDHQSDDSQMEVFFGRFSSQRGTCPVINAKDSAACVEQASKQIPTLDYNAHLFFPDNYAMHFAFLKEAVATGLPSDKWNEAALTHFGTPEETAACARSAQLLMFMIREPLEENKELEAYLNEVEATIRGNKKPVRNDKAGKAEPYILIKETMVLSAGQSLVEQTKDIMLVVKKEEISHHHIRNCAYTL